MRVKCPRCGSLDICASRRRGVTDGVMRAFGLPPRRCSACGWRGYRPRFMKIMPGPTGRTPKMGDPPAPVIATPPAPVAPAHLEASAHSEHKRRHRKHGHHRHKVKTRRGAAVKAVLLAVTLGIGAGFGAHSCANRPAEAAPE